MISRQGVDTTPTVTVNDTSVLSCPVSGTPSPEVVWLRNGQLLDPTLHPNIHLVASGRQLRINSAAVTDTAVYRCLATNKAGQDHLDYNLSVHSESSLRPSLSVRFILRHLFSIHSSDVMFYPAFCLGV